MTKLLEGKNAVITGAGQGIGREIALAFTMQGASVVVNDLGGAMNGTGSGQKPADEVVAEIKKLGGKAVANYDSVADFAGAERIINTCVESFGSIDILVNVAGIVTMALIYDMTEQEFDRVLAVHLKGTFNCLRHASLHMKKQKSGRIINFVSDAWRSPIYQHSHYAAAKGGIASLTRAVAKEMKFFKVTCNAVAPHATTRMTDAFTPEAAKWLYEQGLMEKWMHDEVLLKPGPEHIPAIVVYLASDHAANVTGRMFGASMGRVALYAEPVEAKGLYKNGVWTPEELVELVPKTLMQGLG